jgi:hypothetical protein
MRFRVFCVMAGRIFGYQEVDSSELYQASLTSHKDRNCRGQEHDLQEGSRK